MSASINDLFAKASNGTAPVATTLASQKDNGATSASLELATGWPTTTAVHGIMYKVDANDVLVAGTVIVWKATLAGTTLSNFTVKSGTDDVYPAGSVVELMPTSAWADDLITGILVDHDESGHHKDLHGSNGHTVWGLTDVASAVNNLRATNAVTGSAPQISAEGTDSDIPLNHVSKGNALNQLNGIEIDPTYSFQNAIINGSCRVAQRATPNISTSYQYGAVDRFAAKGSGTAVSAGTIAQTTSPNVTSIGYALKLAGVTITGTGIVYVRYRIEAKDALRFKNGQTSFECKVYHDVGSSINATIYIRKPTTTSDDFSAVTDIANSGAIPVPTGAATAIKFENINSGNIGDVTKGIEIEIQLACGAVTTKNFEFGEFQFNGSPKALPFVPRHFEEDLRMCQRYFEKSFDIGTAPANGADGTHFLTNNGKHSGTYTYTSAQGQVGSYVPFVVHKRTLPTITSYGNSSSQWNYVPSGGSSSWAGMNSNIDSSLSERGFVPEINASITTTGYMSGHWTADSEL